VSGFASLVIRCECQNWKCIEGRCELIDRASKVAVLSVPTKRSGT
jgi:hypothetical protein